MKIYNSLTRKKEDFVPLVPGEVRMYTCGPTVYNLIHVGNARPMIMFDALRRYFEYRGYRVTYVQNFTDVDDKIINRANEEGISPEAVAEKYIGEYFTDAHGLGVHDATIHPKATENIGEIIEMVKRLVEKGYAYEAGGDVYFRTEKFEGYGKLSHQPLEELEAGARVEVGDIKEAPMDFALWKAAKPGEPAWDSPWGPGRPGWHIECSAMSGRYLGKTIDIHCGGQDLQFPHHENEIAQSEAANGCPFVNYWMHNGFLNIDNRKMSKSLGNFFTVREAAAAYGYEPIRFFMLSAHYRSPINYSQESLTQAQSALERLYTLRDSLEFLSRNGEDRGMNDWETDFVADFQPFRERFIQALDDDFNTADAVGVLFELVRTINTAMAENQPSQLVARQSLKFFTELTDVLGLLYAKKTDSLEAEVESLIEARQAARKAKNFAEADRIRDKLKEMGILLEDTPQGVKWRKA
ncbi:MAG TPA: cysteine--tRNA ligase [Oscillospiraceae bacterium]|nr:cysteine--tRNA ligase [Oscillospiraceae bacterium]